MGIGVAPVNFVDIQKDQNAGTVCQIKNNTGGAGAYAAFAVSSNSSAGGLNAYDDGYTADTEFTNKILLYAHSGSTALMLMASKSDGVIEFYTGGYADTDKIGWVHNGGIKANNKNFSSASLALGDDEATSITPVNTTGQIVISCKVSSTGAIIAYKVGASPTCLIIAQPGTVFAVGTGTLTSDAIDGTDGKFNVYTHTDGKIYFKNRYGDG